MPDNDNTTTITNIQREHAKSLDRVYDAISGIKNSVSQTREEIVEVKGKINTISSEMKSLGTLIETKNNLTKEQIKNDLTERINLVKGDMERKIEAHRREKHNSLPPRNNGNKMSNKLIAALITGFVTLTGALAIVVKLID